MRATGIVRRIDDLGRVVIPKEVRKNLCIEQGDAFEIFIDDECQVVLKQCSSAEELLSLAEEYVDVLAKATGNIACVTDMNQIISVAGGYKKELLNKNISSDLEKVILECSVFKANKDDSRFVSVLSSGNTDSYYSEVISPIICEGDAIGAVVFLSSNKCSLMGEVEEKLAFLSSGFIGKQMEE